MEWDWLQGRNDDDDRLRIVAPTSIAPFRVVAAPLSGNLPDLLLHQLMNHEEGQLTQIMIETGFGLLKNFAGSIQNPFPNMVQQSHILLA